MIYFSLLRRHLSLPGNVPVESGDFLGGGQGVWELGLVTHQVEHLADVVVSDEIVG